MLARMDAVATVYRGREISALAQSLATGYLIKSGNYEQAIKRASGVLSAYPKSEFAKLALYDLGSIYWYRLGDPKTGEMYYRQLIKQWPDDDLAISALATLGEWNPELGKASVPSFAKAEVVPTEFRLSQNYPNPFNLITQIQYGLPTGGHVTVKVYNVLGGEVRTLVDRDMPAGNHRTLWDGKDDTGHNVASGVYLYRIVVGPSDSKVSGFVTARKMILSR